MKTATFILLCIILWAGLLIAIPKEEKLHCAKLETQKELKGFYMTEWEEEMCKNYNN
jgi:hypothetical protein